MTKRLLQHILIISLPWIAAYVTIESFFNIAYGLCMNFGFIPACFFWSNDPLNFLHILTFFEIPGPFSLSSNAYPFLNQTDKLLLVLSLFIVIMFFFGILYTTINLFNHKKLGWNLLTSLLGLSFIVRILFTFFILKLGVPNPILPIFPFYSHLLFWTGMAHIRYNDLFLLIIWFLISFYLLYQAKNAYK